MARLGSMSDSTKQLQDTAVRKAVFTDYSVEQGSGLLRGCSSGDTNSAGEHRLRRADGTTSELGRKVTTWCTSTTKGATADYWDSTSADFADYSEICTTITNYVTGFIKLAQLGYANRFIHDNREINDTGFDYPFNDDFGNSGNYFTGRLRQV